MRPVGIFRKAKNDFSYHECFMRAAALAYYAVFSLPAALLIAIYIAGLIYGQAAAAGQISSQLESFVGPQAGGFIEDLISRAGQHRSGGLIASIIALAGLIFSSTTGFAQLQSTLNRIWNVETDEASLESMTRKRITSFLMVIGAGVLLMASMIFGTVVPASGKTLLYELSAGGVYLAQFVVPWIVISILVAAIFKVLPDANVLWKDVTVGALFTAALLVLAKYGMSAYLSHASVAGSYGAAGSLAILLLWLYVSAAILLFGAEFTQAWAEQHGRDVQAGRGARKIRPIFPRAA